MRASELIQLLAERIQRDGDRTVLVEMSGTNERLDIAHVDTCIDENGTTFQIDI